MSHRCPITGCKVASVAAALLMCPTHWRAVPYDLQMDVKRAYANSLKAHKPNMRLAVARALREAQRRAIEAVGVEVRA